MNNFFKKPNSYSSHIEEMEKVERIINKFIDNNNYMPTQEESFLLAQACYLYRNALLVLMNDMDNVTKSTLDVVHDQLRSMEDKIKYSDNKKQN